MSYDAGAGFLKRSFIPAILAAWLLGVSCNPAETKLRIRLAPDIVAFIEESVPNELRDEVFLEVMAKTRQDVLTTNGDAVEIFAANFRTIARPHYRELLQYFDFRELELRSDADVIQRLRDEAGAAVDSVIQVLGRRVSEYHAVETVVVEQSTDRIVLEIPGIEDSGELRTLLQSRGQLSFHQVRGNVDIVSAFAAIDAYLRADDPGSEHLVPGAGSRDVNIDSDARTATAEAGHKTDHAFTSLFVTTLQEDGRQFNYAASEFPDAE